MRDCVCVKEDFNPARSDHASADSKGDPHVNININLNLKLGP